MHGERIDHGRDDMARIWRGAQRRRSEDLRGWLRHSASQPINGDPAMKSTARLLYLYECIYGFAIAVVLIASGVAVASVRSFPGVWFFAPLALAPLGLLALGVARRRREFRRYAHIP